MDNMDIEEDENTENSYGEEAMLIRKLDCKNVKCRKFLTRSFRKLNKLVNKKRNYTLTQSHENIVDSIIQYSKVIKPYSQLQMFEKGPLTSKSYFDQFVAHRKCFKAKVIIDGQVIIDDGFNEQQHFSQQQHKSIFKNGVFNLTLESEPNTRIVYTKNGEHPLLVQPEDRIEVSTNRETTTLEPPLHLNVVVVGFERIESNLATVIVKQNRNGEQSTSSQGMQNRGIVRPNNVYILDESRQMSESFKNIDNSSFLQ